MAKLTLAVSHDVITRAKQHAKQHGTSVSRMVETYLAEISTSGAHPGKATPVLRSLRGILKRGDIQDYKNHLASKYR